MRFNDKRRCEDSTTPSRLTKATVIFAAVLLAVAVFENTAVGAPAYSIYEIQYTAEPNGSSPLEGQVVDCLGGIVTHKFGGFKPKLTIQDPNSSDGWGAIQVKDWVNGALYDEASVGDWVMISNAFVEEFRGNTILQCMAEFAPTLTVVSRGNPIPEPLEITAGAIAAPAPDLYGDWYVPDHSAEQYEHMRLRIRKVVVAETDLGKAADNYAVQDVDDPNSACWVTDYMNPDADDYYHPLVFVGQTLCRIQGILEQYTNIGSGWDCYQLVTTQTSDFVVSQTADFNGDCDVDFVDFRSMAANWRALDCLGQPNACDGTDVNEDGIVGLEDLAQFAQHWLVPEPHGTMAQGAE